MKHLAALICLAAAACTSAADRHVQAVDPGASFTLGVGEAATVKDSGMTLRFVSVNEDSRCPRDTTCIWAGEVKAQFEIRRAANAAARIELNEGGSEVFGEYRVTLVSVEPPRMNATPIAAQAYRVTLTIEATRIAAS